MPGEAETEAVLARRLRRLREAGHLTQQQIASQMTGAGYRMHQTTIAKIEAGERPVTIGEAVALAWALGVGLLDLVTEPDLDELAEALAELARCQARLAAEKDQLHSITSAANSAHRRVEQAHSDLTEAARRVEALRSRAGMKGRSA